MPHTTPGSLLEIRVGLGDRAAMRSALQACVTDTSPNITVRCTMGPFLDAYRGDPEIARLHDALRDGWHRA